MVGGVTDRENPAALGSTDFGRPQSCRIDGFVQRVGEFATYLARHCSDDAGSSGGWVYFGNLVEKMGEGGFGYQTYALAAHGLAALQPGTVEVIGVLPDDSASIKETAVYIMWREFKAWPVQGEERTNSPITVFYRGCQGHFTCCFN
eukprot:2281313-Pyramimonas_sp.AAC.1